MHAGAKGFQRNLTGNNMPMCARVSVYIHISSMDGGLKFCTEPDPSIAACPTIIPSPIGLRHMTLASACSSKTGWSLGRNKEKSFDENSARLASCLLLLCYTSH